MCSTKKWVEWKKWLCALFLNLFLVSCWQKDPSGSYQGEIKDWVYEVYEAPLITQGNACEIEVILKQVSEGFLSQLIFQHPKMEKVIRTGKWKVEDGYRSVFFNDGKSRSTCPLPSVSQKPTSVIRPIET